MMGHGQAGGKAPSKPKKEQTPDLLAFYQKARQGCIDSGYEGEIEAVEGRTFETREPHDLKTQYAYVIINAGMRNQVAEQIFYKYMDKGADSIGHPGKREAIKAMEKDYPRHFSKLQHFKTIEAKLEYLQSLPWIGDITKYHLARNLGIDVAKPDRHMVRLAEHFNYLDVQSMCLALFEKTGHRIGVIDVILWRYCNLNPDVFKWDDSHVEK